MIDYIELGQLDEDTIVNDLQKAMEQVRKATEIITHPDLRPPRRSRSSRSTSTR